MPHCRMLTIDEKKELDEWLKVHNLELNIHTRRDLSDVVPVARIFKKIHPKLVDLHNYTPRNSFSLKLQNWETFNLKVLRKLGLHISKPALVQLANGSVGAIESLLYDLMVMRSGGLHPIARARSVKSSQTNSQKDLSSPKAEPQTISLTHVPKSAIVEKLPPEVLILDVDELINGKIVKAPKKLVPYEDYLDALRECHEKDSFINSVSQKAEYLESLLTVKQERIVELTEQLSRLSVSILSMRSDSLNNNEEIDEKLKNGKVKKDQATSSHN
ncbi:sperm flagellar protein 1-like [Drosophila tropicalis]|uniref:sperm flagellar protein 1-like n=1 Tax=Drosophila tropicalis TaxID=46794 RepID=UPI0035AC1065